MKKIVMAGIASGVLLLGAASAYAAIPDSDDKEFHACVKTAGNSTGHETRLIDKQAGESCASGWTEKVFPGSTYSPGYEVVSNSDTVTHVTEFTLSATCPTGKRPVGGSLEISTPSDTGAISNIEGEKPNGQQWTVTATAASQVSETITATVYATCINS